VSGRRIGLFALAYITAYTFACFVLMRFVPRHLFRRAAPDEEERA